MMGHQGHTHVLEILFHPPLVHFPIAFYFLELIFLMFWAIRRDGEYYRFAGFVFRLGYIFMLGSMVAGIIDAGGWSEIQGPIRRHFYGALAVFAVYTARGAVFWLRQGAGSDRLRYANLLTALIGNGLVGYAGYLGGLLVYG